MNSNLQQSRHTVLTGSFLGSLVTFELAVTALLGLFWWANKLLGGFITVPFFPYHLVKKMWFTGVPVLKNRFSDPFQSILIFS